MIQFDIFRITQMETDGKPVVYYIMRLYALEGPPKRVHLISSCCVQYNQIRLSGRHFDSHLDDSLSNVNCGSLGLHTSVETALNRYNWIPPMGWNLDLKFRSSEPRAAANSQATRFKNNKNKLTFIRRQFQCRSYII